MITEKQDRGLMEPNPDVLRANAYHEAGRATTLGLYVQEIAIRDDRPGENTKFTGHAEHLPLVDQVAICNAGRQAEETGEVLFIPAGTIHYR